MLSTLSKSYYPCPNSKLYFVISPPKITIYIRQTIDHLSAYMVQTENTRQENENNYTKIEAARPDEQYLSVTSGKEPEDLTPRQQTCNICGLTARNKEELQDHIRNAHANVADTKES